LRLSKTNTMTKFDSDFDNSKDKRREKFGNKKHKPKSFDDNDDIKRKNLSKQELKKIKETYEEEEWEDWDRHYNH
jgi:hypothetical protein